MEKYRNRAGVVHHGEQHDGHVVHAKFPERVWIEYLWCRDDGWKTRDGHDHRGDLEWGVHDENRHAAGSCG
jgi:hypothetical protein